MSKEVQQQVSIPSDDTLKDAPESLQHELKQIEMIIWQNSTD